MTECFGTGREKSCLPSEPQQPLTKTTQQQQQQQRWTNHPVVDLYPSQVSSNVDHNGYTYDYDEEYNYELMSGLTMTRRRMPSSHSRQTNNTEEPDRMVSGMEEVRQRQCVLIIVSKREASTSEDHFDDSIASRCQYYLLHDDAKTSSEPGASESNCRNQDSGNQMTDVRVDETVKSPVETKGVCDGVEKNGEKTEMNQEIDVH